MRRTDISLLKTNIYIWKSHSRGYFVAWNWTEEGLPAFSIVLVNINCTLASLQVPNLTTVFLQNSVIMTLNAFTQSFFFPVLTQTNECNHQLPPWLPLDFTQINAHLYDHNLRDFQSLLSLQNCLGSYFFFLSTSFWIPIMSITKLLFCSIPSPQ